MRDVLTSVVKALFHSDIMVGLVAMSMIYSSSTLLGISIGPAVYAAGFLIFFSAYSLNRVLEIEEDARQHKSRAKYVGKYHRQILAFSLAAYAIGVALIGLDRPDLVPLAFVPLVFVILYTVKLPTGHRFKRIKDITIGKNMGVAVAWTLFVVVLVDAYAGSFSFLPLMITSFFFISRIFVNTVVFDMRDHDGDKANGIRTMPVHMGLEKTKHIVMIINAFIGVFMLAVGLVGLMGPLAYFAAASSLYAAFYMYLLEKKESRKNVICDFVVDGEYFAKSLFLFAGTLII